MPREKSRDAVPRGEDVARPITRFEVDRHPTKIKEGKLELIRDMYQVPDYVEFQLLGLTRPPPGHITIYRDYFWKEL